MNNDLYDVSKYTDQQLYDVLDINNPTDRELEAKIVHMIDKYSIMQNDSGYKLAVFFQDIYSHFFNLESYTDIVEGFDNNPLQVANNYIDQSGNVQNNIENAINTNTNYNTTNATIQNIQSTTSFDYVKDKFGLNPLLKQTIKRIICIDSQYRDNKNKTLSTDFTFNLSEPLRDVVSLKLESIQIPVTWYTISKSFGSNFFYLKGNLEGIDNGYHDYKFEITPKYYTLSKSDTNNSNIYDAINEAIIDTSNTCTDVNFGNTNIQSIIGSSKSKFTIDIQKVYDYPYFYLSFPNWTTPNVPDDSNYLRSNTISSYLGFNQQKYDSNTLFSNQTILNTSQFIQTQNLKQFKLDNSNNFFDIVRYSGVEYNTSSIIDTYRIKLSLPIDISYSTTILYDEVNNKLSNSIYLDVNYSKLNRIDVSNINDFNYGKSYYTLNIKLNRYTIKQQPNTNLAVIFPNSSNNLWSNCFKFDNIINELNTIYSETELVKTDYIVDSSVNIVFECLSPPEYIDVSNNFKIIFTNSTYTLNTFIIEIDKKLKENYYSSNSTLFINENEKITFDINIEKKFVNDDFDFKLDYDNDKRYALETIGILSIFDNNNIITGNFLWNNNNIILDSSYILSYATKNNTKYNHIYLTDNINKKVDESGSVFYNYPNYTKLIEHINFSIANHLFYSQYPFVNSSITSSGIQTIDGTGIYVSVSFNLNINFYLKESNYKIIFNDKNDQLIWSKMELDNSYDLINYSNNILNKSIIIGNDKVSSNLLSIDDIINILPYYDPSGGAYSILNQTSISINSTQRFTIYSLINYFNDFFNTNPMFSGSYMTTYIKNSNEYVKLQMNINVIYTTKDYKIVFYDPYSFIKCFIGVTSIKNTTWDSTLGWILGFRDHTEYVLTKSNQTNNGINNTYIESPESIYEYNTNITNNNITNTIINLTGDTSCTLNIYNYFYIILQDYIQNHINDGLVSISKTQTSIALPSYSSQSTEICDPVTNTPIIATTNKSGLTSKQVYSLNQSLISKRNKVKSYSSVSYVNDIFAMIPLRISGIHIGSYYVETGGNLQNQERLYFGPVNIKRMSVKLVNDKGDVVDLNKVDWSFSFICEQLYRK